MTREQRCRTSQERRERMKEHAAVVGIIVFLLLVFVLGVAVGNAWG